MTLNLMESSAWQIKIMDDADFELFILVDYQNQVILVLLDVNVLQDQQVLPPILIKMDEALLVGTAESDVDSRKLHYDTVQRLISEDLPIILLIDNGYKIPNHKDFNGFSEQEQHRAASSEITYIKRATNE